MFTADGGWYRSVVTETFPNGSYNVQYVDFGNRAILPGEQLRPMKPDSTELPILAFKCALHGKTQEYEYLMLFLYTGFVFHSLNLYILNLVSKEGRGAVFGRFRFRNIKINNHIVVSF